MNITAWRITHKRFSRTLWSGAGAREFGGRWNPKGIPVVYAAQSKSLAALEQLVHLIQPRVLRSFVVASITFDARLVQTLDVAKLPAGWNRPVAPPQLRQVGLRWFEAATYPVLAVPSCVIAGEWTYLINPVHSAFKRMHGSRPVPFAYDPRLE